MNKKTGIKIVTLLSTLFLLASCQTTCECVCNGGGGGGSSNSDSGGGGGGGSDSGDQTGVRIIDPSTYSGNEITLRLWQGFSDADGKAIKSLVDSFNSEYRGCIKIENQMYAWDVLFRKLGLAADDPSTAPHMVFASSDRAVDMVYQNIFLPMNDAESVLGVTSADYLQSAWDAGTYGLGDRYSLPLDVHPVALYYNKDIVSESQVPETWDEFLSICQTLTSGSVYGWTIPNVYSITKDVFYSMLVQNGGDILDENENIIFANNTAVNTLQTLYDWKYGKEGSKAISPTTVNNGGDETLFTTGYSAFYFDLPAHINTFNDKFPDLNYGIAPLPESTGEYGTSIAGTHQMAMIKCSVTTNTLKSAAYTFMKYVEDHEEVWAQGGNVPAKKSVLTSPQIKTISNYQYLKPFIDMAYTSSAGHTHYRYSYIVYNQMGVAVAEALNKTKSVRDALSYYAGVAARKIAEG